MTLPLHAESPCTWRSTCGRYQVIKQLVCELLTGQYVELRVLFYGHQVYAEGGSAIERHLESVAMWCEEHRRRVLPAIVEFEAFIARRYGEAQLCHILGPMARRDRVKELIEMRGERRLPVKHQGTGVSSMLEEIFAELYEGRAPQRHENGDGQ